MNEVTNEYKRKVWQFLEEIQPGNMYSIEKLAKPANREAFVAAVKEYMESLPYQGFVTFNSDYTKIYKTTALPLEILRESRQLNESKG